METAVVSPSYAGAAAHDPRFDDRSLWAHLDGREAYTRQVWPKGRLLVWAHPGTSGSPMVRDSLNPEDAANWLEDGKPAADAAFDENTDLLLPAADTPYRVGVFSPVRHVTVEKNAGWHALGKFGGNMTIYGNVWIKRGGRIYVGGNTALAGPHHTFYRNDDLANIRCSQHLQVNKPSGASAEILGHVTVLDEFTVFDGAAVVGPDSKFQPGRNSMPTIRPGGALALMDGAVWAKWQNDWTARDLEVGGTVQGGLADRPLTRDAYLLLHFKNYTGAGGRDAAAGNPRERGGASTRAVSLVLRDGAALRSYTADAASARLVVTYGGVPWTKYRPEAGSENERRSLAEDPQRKNLYAWLDALPRHIDVWAGKGVVLQTVRFDYLHAGGLMAADPADADAWRDVTFGPNCAGSGKELLGQAPALDRQGAY
jgi:hypothetical protein